MTLHPASFNRYGLLTSYAETMMLSPTVLLVIACASAAAPITLS